MKKLPRLFLYVILCAFLGTVLSVTAQEKEKINKKLKEYQITIPFIDRDGDGINDLVQSGWGLKFLEQFKNRGVIWDQLIIPGKDEEQLVDTDGDGEPDTSFREYFSSKMSQPVDTDGDGKLDTPLQEHMRKRFQSFDGNGDGIPDPVTPEQIREYMEDMREWRSLIKSRLLQGAEVFGEQDGTGIPKSFPSSFGIAKRYMNAK